MALRNLSTAALHAEIARRDKGAAKVRKQRDKLEAQIEKLDAKLAQIEDGGGRRRRGPGRPKKTLKKGVKVRIKNKGSQAHKQGPKRPKYQTPWEEHPETEQPVEEQQIHANHAEAFFSALRRKCSAFRRKTNTYAKTTTGLQRLLDVYWVMHNFVRFHFTTREVPAVSLGVIDRPFSVRELFLIQMA